MLLHHANQLLVTDGYADRDGIGPVADAVVSLVRLHDQLAVPASLHLSGTLVEALAWHRPDVLDVVRGATADGLLEAVGGAYGEPVMTLLTERAVRRHLRAGHEVAERHLRVRPTSAWVPERVWSPAVGRLLVDAGYERTALDDRLLLAARDRPALDAGGPWAARPTVFDPTLCRPVRERSSGLPVVPIAAALRYLVPPRDDADLELAAAMARALPEDAVLVYADDLERTCGVAGWEPALDRYERFLREVAQDPTWEAVRLDAVEEPTGERDLEAGTYYELAHLHGAGERYRTWADDPRWAPYALLLDGVEADLDAAPAGASTDLAERLLMVGQHETAWQDLTADGTRAPAPWACATAAHARDARPVLHAGRWARAGGCPPSAALLDVDGDGEDELVLADGALWCLLWPRSGGRVGMVAVRDGDDARLVVGNPLDHWNFQRETARFMQQPPGHPGAFTRHDGEDEPWDVELPEAVDDVVRVVLRRGASTRRLLLSAGRLLACWDGPGEVVLESLLTPDYLAAVRHGSAGTTSTGGPGWAAVTREGATTWLGWGLDGVRAGPRYELAGHGLPVAVRGAGHLDVLLGTGPVPDDVALEVDRLRGLLHVPALLGPLPGRERRSPTT